jgi:hypothetical protein
MGGGFVFDDIVNLSPLTHLHDSPELFSSVVLSNTSGPTGRPVAMLSFAMQSVSWPSNPMAFQLVNISLHALTAGLVYLLFQRLHTLFTGSQDRVRVNLVCVFGALIWALHPGNVSSVLYVVQRMNLLAVFFGMLFLLFALVFMERTNKEDLSYRTPKLFGAGVVLSVFIALSIFSKENGVLFLGLAPMIYLLLFPKHQQYHKFIVGLSIAIVTVGFFWFANKLAGYIDFGYGARDFTLSERVLTQTWVTLNYVVWFFIPTYKHFYFFHDDIQLITSVFDVRFLAALFGWAGLIFLAWKFRLFRFGLAWFVIGHLLESTIVPLEMVFEHRNYLATIGFAFVASWCIFVSLDFLGRKSAAFALVVLIAVLIVNFSMVANSWSSRENMTHHWSRLNPESTRIIGFKADYYANTGDFENAEKSYKKIVELDSFSVRGFLSLLELQCVYPEADFVWQDFVARAQVARFEVSITNTLGEIMDFREQGDCKNIPNGLLWAVVQVLKENKQLIIGKAESNYLLLEGRLCLEVQDFDCFINKYETVAFMFNNPVVTNTLYAVYGELYGDDALKHYKNTITTKVKESRSEP